jgi:hypothetical protein
MVLRRAFLFYSGSSFPVLLGEPGVMLILFVPDPDGVASPDALCQWPCSGDQTFPSGVGPGGCGVNSPPDLGVAPGVIEIGFVPAPDDVAASGALCQWSCSEDQTLPSGVDPRGCGCRG